MQREKFLSPNSKPPPSSGEELAWNDDEDPADQDSPRREKVVPWIGYQFGMAVLGVVLALAWWNFDGLWSGIKLWPASAAPSQNASTSGVKEQFARIDQKIDLLTKSISDFGRAQQQMATDIASLQAGQQELQKRDPSLQADKHWYSDPAGLQFRTGAQQTPPAPQRKPSAQIR